MSEHLVERLTASGEWAVEDLPWPDDVDRFRWLDGYGLELVLEIGDTDPPGLGLAIRGYRRRTGEGAGPGGLLRSRRRCFTGFGEKISLLGNPPVYDPKD